MFSVRGRAHLIGVGKKIITVAGVTTATAIFSVVFSAVTFGVISPADALPSFARQTGQPCGTCHTDFPGLTPYGRRFKIEGYTTGGGKYRTTLFPEWKPDPLATFSKDAKSVTGKKSGAGADGQQQDEGQGKTWVPPISMMAIVGYTHTQASQMPPCGGPYKCNDNLVASPISFFYGGAITEHIGAFAQVTYNGAPAGAPYISTPNDPYATFQWSWDNTDVRYANTMMLGNVGVTYGITGNNNPTVQDPWNTTPAWQFPYNNSNVAPKLAAHTLIDGGLSAHVAGVGGYALVNDMLYLELTGYRSVSYSAQTKLGLDPFGAPGLISGVAPYWRIALEPHWGNHWLEFGAFGMTTRINVWDTGTTDSNGLQVNALLPQSNRYTDTGYDAQYQYQGDNYWLTLRGTYIHENQTLDATFNNPAGAQSDNPTNTLNTFKALASLAYGNDNRVVLTGQYFKTYGSSDATVYAANPGCGCSPNSDGYIFDVAYIPFISSQAPGWPWANMRVGLQYTYYNNFNGDSVFAHDNNTLFGYIWFAM